MNDRWDETWHRLREWTLGQGPSERLAAQLLIFEGYSSFDPSHPLGGKDGGKDGLCNKNNETWVLAVYFPRGQKTYKEIKTKFEEDLKGVESNSADGLVFVTNQELKLSERKQLKALGNVDLIHLERATTILDSPDMAQIRKQFLNIDLTDLSLSKSVKNEIEQLKLHLESLQTGGSSYCYWMLYHFDLDHNVARNFVIIRKGNYPLYDLRLRICDMNTGKDVFSRAWGELNSPADFYYLSGNFLMMYIIEFFFMLEMDLGIKI